MNKLTKLAVVVALVVTVPLAREALAEQDSTVADITLKTTNTVVFNDAVRDKSISKLINDIENTTDETVYLFISSPGGSVQAGAALISYFRATEKKIVCIAEFAASMAFAILQECPRRIVMSHSIIMQHEASYSLPAAPVPQQRTLITLIERQVSALTVRQALRMNMPLPAFKARVRDDYWIYGMDAVVDGAADAVETVSCTPELRESTTELERKTLFGSVKLVFSGCPLISYPIDIVSGEFKPFNSMSATEIKLINTLE